MTRRDDGRKGGRVGLGNRGRPGHGLGSRILRRGAHGADVARLQILLRARGYDPGPADGAFGLLTEDALRRLQADYGLRSDGVAGPEVFGLLMAPRPVPVRRVSWPVQGRPSLEEAAAAMGVAPEYLARVNRLGNRRGIEPGSTLVAFPRWLVLEVGRSGRGAGADRIVERYGARVSAVVDARTPPAPGQGSQPTPGAHAPQTPSGDPPPPLPWPEGTAVWIHVDADLTRLDPGWRRTAREGAGGKGVQSLARWAAGLDPSGRVRGLHVERSRVPWGLGAAWARGAAALSEGLWRHGLTLWVTLPLPDVRRLSHRLFGDLHLPRWVPLAEAVMVPAPDVGGPDSFRQWYARLEAVRPFLPLWKCVALLDVRAVERDGQGRVLRRLSHQQALSLCYRHRVRPVWDPEGACSRAVYREEGQERHLALWARPALVHWLERVRLWGLAGLCLRGVGPGEERLLEEALRHTAVARYVGPVPGIMFPEGEGGSSP